MAGRETLPHQPRFADPRQTLAGGTPPSVEGPVFRLANVDPRNHSLQKKTPSSRGSKSLLDAEQTAERPGRFTTTGSSRGIPGHPLQDPASRSKPARGRLPWQPSCRNRRNAAVCSGRALNLPKTPGCRSFTLSQSSVISVSRNPGKTRFTRFPFFPTPARL